MKTKQKASSPDTQIQNPEKPSSARKGEKGWHIFRKSLARFLLIDPVPTLFILFLLHFFSAAVNIFIPNYEITLVYYRVILNALTVLLAVGIIIASFLNEERRTPRIKSAAIVCLIFLVPIGTIAIINPEAWGLSRVFFFINVFAVLYEFFILCYEIILSLGVTKEKPLIALLTVSMFFLFLGGAFLSAGDNLLSRLLFQFGVAFIYFVSIALVGTAWVRGKKQKTSLSLTGITISIVLISALVFGAPFLLQYLYLVPENIVENVIVPIYSALVGGTLTLAGVGWTIKFTNKMQEKMSILSVKPFLISNAHPGEKYPLLTFKILITTKKQKDILKYWVLGETENNQKEKYYCFNTWFNIKNTDNGIAVLKGVSVAGVKFDFSTPYILEKDYGLTFRFDDFLATSEDINCMLLLFEDVFGTDYDLKIDIEKIEKSFYQK